MVEKENNATLLLVIVSYPLRRSPGERNRRSSRSRAGAGGRYFRLRGNRCSLARPAARTISIDDVREPIDPRASDGGLEDHDRDQAVRRAVFALPEKYREALILFYFHEMDVPAAARSLGLPEGTLKARLFRGREILRGKLPQLLAVPRLKEA